MSAKMTDKVEAGMKELLRPPEKKVAKVKALVTTNNGQRMMESTSPAASMIQAISAGANLETVAKMMELQQAWEANEARKAYHLAMAAFKANPPEIEKDRKVSYSTSKGAVSYSHSDLGIAAQKISKALSPHGLSATWRTSQNGKMITVTCRITHEKGHSEETSLSAEPDDSGGKNTIQAIGSAVYYLERYTLFASTGLAPLNMDNDAQSPPAEKITAEDVNSLMDHLQSIEVPVKQLCEYMKVEKLEDILKADMKKAMTAIEAAKEKRGKK